MRYLRCICVAAALAAFGASAPSATARAYDVHIFRVTNVKLDGSLKLDIVPSGAGLTEHMTRSAKLTGRPAGGLRISSPGRNVAFFREAVSRGGVLTAGSMSGVFAQAGNYTMTREDTVYDQNDNPSKVTRVESTGDCTDRRTARFALTATFRVRAGKLVGLFRLPRHPDLKDCQGALDDLGEVATTASGIARARTATARALTFPIRYRKARSRTEDGVKITQVESWAGSVTLAKVKDCPFRRGVDQYSCFGRNPDGL